MITDVHTHIWETPDQLGRGAAKHIRRHVKQPWDRPDASVSAHETAMMPVQAVLVHGFESRYLGASVPAKQVANHVARNPDKYMGFAGVDPLGDFRSQIAEAKQLGLVGVTICPAGQSCHPSHSRAMKVYQLCADAGMPIFVHPATHLGTDAKLEFAQPYLFDEIAREFPSLRIIIGQIGYPWIDQALTLVGKHDHVYAELSNVVSRPWQLYNTLLTAHQLGVTDHLLFGSDYPFCTPEKAITTIYSVNTLTQGTPLPSVPREKLRSIVERDVLACLGLAAPRTVDEGDEVDSDDASANARVTASAAAGAVAVASGNGREPTIAKSNADTSAKSATTASDKPQSLAKDATSPASSPEQAPEKIEPASEQAESTPSETTSTSSDGDTTIEAKGAEDVEDQASAASDSPVDAPVDSQIKTDDSKAIHTEATDNTSATATPPPIPVSSDEARSDSEEKEAKEVEEAETKDASTLATEQSTSPESADESNVDESVASELVEADATEKTIGVEDEETGANDSGVISSIDTPDESSTADAPQPKKESDA